MQPDGRGQASGVGSRRPETLWSVRVSRNPCKASIFTLMLRGRVRAFRGVGGGHRSIRVAISSLRGKRMSVTAATASLEHNRAMSAEERKVIFASSLGTVFEWYDFYLYGSLAAIIGSQLLLRFDATTAQHLRAARLRGGLRGPAVRRAGVRPAGRPRRAASTPSSSPSRSWASHLRGRPAARLRARSASPRRSILIALRLLQGLALGGEYGGAATYVAEHAPQGRRGFYTSWIQTTATLGLFLSLLVILFTRACDAASRRSPTGAGACRSWSRSCCWRSRCGSACSSTRARRSSG